MERQKQVKQTNIFTDKIYLSTILPKEFCKKINNIKEFLINEDIIIHLYSNEGIFTIENNQIYKLIPHDKPIKKIIFEQNENNKVIDLTIDSSCFEKIQVFSQIPSDHIVNSFTRKRYSLSKTFKSLLHLIIEEMSGVPINYYFLLNDAFSFNDILVKKELDIFLSLIN